MLMAYASVAAFFLVAGGFVFVSLIAGRFIRPNNLYPEKLETYECGEAPVGPAWFNFNPRFYIIALIFIIFDVEIAFIYPVARVPCGDLLPMAALKRLSMHRATPRQKSGPPTARSAQRSDTVSYCQPCSTRTFFAALC